MKYELILILKLKEFDDIIYPIRLLQNLYKIINFYKKFNINKRV